MGKNVSNRDREILAPWKPQLVNITHQWIRLTDVLLSFLLILTFNTLRPRQNGRHFADDTFKRIFMNENVWISTNISLKFVPKGLINNIPALVQIRLGADQATSHYLNQWWLIYWRIYASLGLNELKWTYQLNTRSQICPSIFTFAINLTLNF